MDPLTLLVLTKAGRFVLGLLVTAVAIALGVWHGRRLAARGVTGENYFQQEKVDGKVVLRMIVTSLTVVGVLVYLDRRTTVLNVISPYFTQGSMVVLRSLLCFLFAVQWQIWQDRTRLKRSLIVLGVAFLVFLTVEVLILLPSYLLIQSEIGPDGVIIQTTRTTCGPASLANVLRVYGRPVTEREVAIAMATGMTGTTDEEAARGAKLLGFPEAAPWRPTVEDILREDRPLIVTIESCGVMHDVAVVGASSYTVTIADPYVGLVEYTLKDFRATYQKRGVRLGKPEFTHQTAGTLSTFEAGVLRRFGASPPTR